MICYEFHKWRCILLSAMTVLLFVLPGYSQKTMVEGYIITLDGDTVQGLIRERKWPQTPRKVEFVTGGKGKVYWPEEIDGFGTGNLSFISKKVKVDVSPHKPGQREKHPNPVFVTDTVFLQLIVKAEKSLYYYRDPAYKDHFYLVHSDGNPEALIYKEWISFTYYLGKNRMLVGKNDEYKNQLREAFSDCLQLRGRIAVTPYAVAEMRELFEAYKVCGATDQVAR